MATDGSKYAGAAAKKFCQIIPNDGDIQIRIVSVTESLKPMGTEPFGISNDYYVRAGKELEKAAEGFVADAKKIIAIERDARCVEALGVLSSAYPGRLSPG